MTGSNAKYLIIEQNIIDKITKGNYKPDQKIESESELCKIYSTSRITVRRALDDLCMRNILYRKQGAGTFVRENAKTEIGSIEKKQIFVITPYFIRLMSNVAQTYLPQIYEHIDNEKYTVNTIMEPSDEAHEQEFIDSIRKQNAAGVIYYYFNRETVLEKLKQLGIPVVLVDIEPKDNPFDVVTGEDFDSAYRAVLSLLANGCRKIGFFSQFPAGMSTSDLREDGVRQALKDNGIEIEERCFYHCSGCHDENVYKWLLDKAVVYFRKNPDLDAVIAVNDDAALPLLGAVGELGGTAAENLKVISYGNYSVCNLPSIGLTSYEQHLEAYAAEAAKLLTGRIEGRLPNLQQRRIIKYELIKRRTF